MDELNKPDGDGLPSGSPKNDGGDPVNEHIRKKVDESWKQNVEKEKQEQKAPGEFVPPEPDFKFFITTLTLQASIALGHMANPSTGKTEEDPVQAKFIIDTLGMLKEKTRGNLNEEEEQLLEHLLYELRVAYLAKEEKK